MLNASQMIEQIISDYYDASFDMTLGESKIDVVVELKNNALNIQLTLGFPANYMMKSLQTALTALLEQKTQFTEITVAIDWLVTKHKVQPGIKSIAGIKNIIAVASGKGGVGKSTTSINLALALSAEGARVGILDADIYGPSQPRMLGISAPPESTDGKSMEPLLRHGLQTMSIGFLIDEEQPMIWRGPMVTQALEQMLNDTNWRDLDYLVVDLPPGTGDTQLTLSQKVPVSGAVIVTTPQDIALLDAKKALKMFAKVNVPVLGIIENMSTHICSQCHHEEPIFGKGGAKKMAQQYDVDLLGSLPLDIRIREDADHGNPTVIADGEHSISRIYRTIAIRIAARLAKQAKDYSSVFPDIVIKHD